MAESILPQWIFLYGTMIAYLVLGTAGLWLSGKALGHGDPVGEPGSAGADDSKTDGRP
jgi:hypothetical protein